MKDSATFKTVDRWMKPLARRLHGEHMELLGLRATMRLAKASNGLQYRRFARFRQGELRDRFQSLLEENGKPATTSIEMKDGWALDRTASLPHLQPLLDESAEIIAERGLKPSKPGESHRSFFQSILKGEDLQKYPSILNFVLSSDVLNVVCQYLNTIPILSTTLPPGVRLAESSITFDSKPHEGFRESQVYHLDHHDRPMVYVIVLLKDVTKRCGPFCFLPISTSERATRALRYQSRDVDYRVTDEQMYKVIDAAEMQEMSLPRGTVLFLDSSLCFHYGSRNAFDPRYQMMYALTSVCRTDFTEWFMEPLRYPIKEQDSRLRKMVLNKRFME
jgi:hypothetical protein